MTRRRVPTLRELTAQAREAFGPGYVVDRVSGHVADELRDEQPCGVVVHRAHLRDRWWRFGALEMLSVRIGYADSKVAMARILSELPQGRRR